MEAKSKNALAKNHTTTPTSAHDENGPFFFFKASEAYGEFCQWYPATFTVSKSDMSALVGHPINDSDPDGWKAIYFNCAEQFMMYCKAGRFRDAETQRHILESREPEGAETISQVDKGLSRYELGRN